jgi:hypothetical protein
MQLPLNSNPRMPILKLRYQSSNLRYYINEIKQQTVITNVQDTCSIGDISPEEAISEELAVNIVTFGNDQYDNVNSSPSSVSVQKSLGIERWILSWNRNIRKRLVMRLNNTIRRRNFCVNWCYF